jgi:hypothetical protein
MEKIKIGSESKMYEILSIKKVADNLLAIQFVDDIPDKFGDISLFTAGGLQCANLPGFATVYLDEGKTVYLSDDGSVYKATEPTPDPEPVPEPTAEELLATAVASKKAEISAACEQIIYAGVNVKISTGWEHFALTEHDQINLFGKQAQLASGVEQLEYHADGQPCRYYSAADMQAIINAAMFHVSYHTTYCNSIYMWLAGCQTVEKVQEIYYGADVPEQYQSDVLKAYLLQIATATECDNDDTQAAE